jgi:hypothetical protein
MALLDDVERWIGENGWRWEWSGDVAPDLEAVGALVSSLAGYRWAGEWGGRGVQSWVGWSLVQLARGNRRGETISLALDHRGKRVGVLVSPWY